MEDYAQAFITALEKLGGKATNKSLKETLGWGVGEYVVVKRELSEKGLIKLGRGRGGTVKLANSVDPVLDRAVKEFTPALKALANN